MHTAPSTTSHHRPDTITSTSPAMAARPKLANAAVRTRVGRATPEPPRAPGFVAQVENYRLGDGALNRVTFPEHVVRRSAADIAASNRSCFYLNLKLAGRCGRHIYMLSADSRNYLPASAIFSITMELDPPCL